MTVVMSLVFVVCGTAMSAPGGFAEPLTNNGRGFVWIALRQFADPVHGLGVDLALNLGDVDQRRCAAGGNEGLTGRAAFSALRAAVGQCRQRTLGARGNDFGGQDSLDQR